MDAGVFESAPVQGPPGSHHRPGAHHRDRNRVLSFPQNAGGTAEKESLVAFRASTELSRGRDSGRRPFLGAPSRLSSDRTGGSVISTLEEKDSYDVGGAKSDGHGGAESSCQKHRGSRCPMWCSFSATQAPLLSMDQALAFRSPTRQGKGGPAIIDFCESKPPLALRGHTHPWRIQRLRSCKPLQLFS